MRELALLISKLKVVGNCPSWQKGSILEKQIQNKMQYLGGNVSSFHVQAFNSKRISAVPQRIILQHYLWRIGLGCLLKPLQDGEEAKEQIMKGKDPCPTFKAFVLFS